MSYLLLVKYSKFVHHAREFIEIATFPDYQWSNLIDYCPALLHGNSGGT